MRVSVPLCVRGISHGTQRRYCRLGPWIWTEREMTASSGTFRGAARSIHALFTGAQSRRMCVDGPLQFLKVLSHHRHMASGGAARTCRPGRAAEASPQTSLSLGWSRPLLQGRVCAACPVPACGPGGRTRGRLGFVVKTQRLLLKYDRELTGACVNRKYLHAINVRSDKRLGRTELGKRLFP